MRENVNQLRGRCHWNIINEEKLDKSLKVRPSSPHQGFLNWHDTRMHYISVKF